MGKSCIRFKKAEDLALDVVGDTIRTTPVDAFIAFYESVISEPNEARAERRKKSASKKATSTKTRPEKPQTAVKKRSAKP
jgi:hypothetical protein